MGIHFLLFLIKVQIYFFKGSRSWPFIGYVEINPSEIYALQLIGGYISGSDSDYYNYQINLINKDAERLNVVFFTTNKEAKKNAQILKDFLNTRLWDAT